MFEIVRVDERASELVREERKEKGRGRTERESEQELVKRKREGASGSEAGLPLKYCSLSFASLRKLSLFSLPVSPSCSLHGHDPGGHLDLLAYIEKRRETL